jgi:hypothetical protein
MLVLQEGPWRITSSSLKHTHGCNPCTAQQRLSLKARTQVISESVLAGFLARVKEGVSTAPLKAYLRQHGVKITAAQQVINLKLRALGLASRDPSRLSDITLDPPSDDEFDELLVYALGEAARMDLDPFLTLLQEIKSTRPGFDYKVTDVRPVARGCATSSSLVFMPPHVFITCFRFWPVSSMVARESSLRWP